MGRRPTTRHWAAMPPFALSAPLWAPFPRGKSEVFGGCRAALASSSAPERANGGPFRVELAEILHTRWVKDARQRAVVRAGQRGRPRSKNCSPGGMARVAKTMTGGPKSLETIPRRIRPSNRLRSVANFQAVNGSGRGTKRGRMRPTRPFFCRRRVYQGEKSN